MRNILDSRNISSTTVAKSISIAEPKASTCDHVCGGRLVTEEGRSPSLLDKVLALAYGIFFVSLAVVGSLWILADLSATLLPAGHVG